MKNPNGYGSCFKMSGNRRKPFVARLTVGHTEKGFPIYKVLGYFRTRSEGLVALADYHKQPYSLDTRNMALKEVFYNALASDKSMADNTRRNHKNIWKYLEPIAEIAYHEINLGIMQNLVNNQDKPTVAIQIKKTLRFLDKYALQSDIITKGYAEFIKLPTYETQHIREPFDRKEIELLWEHSNDDTAKVILLYLYTGFRRNELADLKKENVNDGCIVGGSKTKAGKNRIIPVHSRIEWIISEFMAREGDYLVPREYCNFTFFHTKFGNYCEQILGKKHIPHECRHTFVSELSRKGGDSVCIDRLAGHSSGHVGRDVYTHKSIEELKNTIELLD